MPKYAVEVTEVWVQTYYIEADNPAAAQYAVADGNGENGNFEYSRVLNDSPDDYTVTEIPDAD